MLNKLKEFLTFSLISFSLILSFVFQASLVFAQTTKESPMVINGDNVEYSHTNRPPILLLFT